MQRLGPQGRISKQLLTPKDQCNSKMFVKPDNTFAQLGMVQGKTMCFEQEQRICEREGRCSRPQHKEFAAHAKESMEPKPSRTKMTSQLTSSYISFWSTTGEKKLEQTEGRRGSNGASSLAYEQNVKGVNFECRDFHALETRTCE